MTSRIVVAGGGTAGHVNPLLATAVELRARGYRVEALGTQEGLEADLVERAGFALKVIEKVPFPRRPSASALRFPAKWRRAVDECEKVIEGAACVVGFGGYVSTPAYRAAKRLGVPVVIHEQNARPGLANRVGARFARLVALTFANTPLEARRGRTEVVGLPLRPAIRELALARRSSEDALRARLAAAERLGVDPDRRILLVTGGSLGALAINEAVCAAAKALPEGAAVVHLTGRGKDAPVRDAVEAAGVSDRWLVLDYLRTMEDALAVADLVLCRSGAGTVAEMTALGLPCVYAPLPIGNGEQRLNAHDHVASGGALLIPDARLDAHAVETRVFALLASPELDAMARASRGLGRVDAAADFSALIEEVIGR
ncbi:UDP-N-acetylglucosamine--N-acetylmuramyl-(pentapeptide) pyrophosphoryl-undecaprenol N-acetylglucosamine transferase [Schaalia hyovaginalis]|uniref:UDP-N-acetylglucosamine--N-acetylmuramyl-(pentapeptide) pyrophosphoryl-undecaprenol N-acetylglucosamine transferase n=1 Tax=Schaalia hyovaginalis TaxID=29316 RepID=A0A923E1X2_9ACTO|nr:UDP-N-acetylglucosamine--N-acetylmuramyl-(pentapeptide) pyrophosphoryl-undecaprenol N-acetylglucosamine transferase [Schaalia hyovaginalis]MBB6334453.1 UDP-N-acetylglucosamine--N-acetylmuramyl-(pentapeptide) pyrophosphoryl-undecaprenol N-acetylglucosamine transferase [Schaalia hyovaginalis]MDY2668702.1 UDP-N-acetylglucosamine--N-acetylmuramyl-(pentapeptide) pyrophosphoryl-undecaprenol N-acetylglucosamine transferase [Schaalia hyovaginalis]